MRIITIIATLAMCALATDLHTAHERAVAANPRGVTFRIGVVGNRQSVHQGEVVEIEIALAADAKAQVVLAGGRHFLGHRSTEVSFVVDPPDGAPDPLAGYEDSWLFNPADLRFGGLSGGAQTSLQDRIVLNEHVRFDRPGRYALYAVSRAAKPKAAGAHIDEDTPGVATASNVLELEVLPAGDDWAREELGRIVAALDRTPGPGDTPVPYEAFRRLSFLGGDDAMRESIRRLTGDSTAYAAQLGLGLLARPNRAATLAALEARLEAPDQAVGVAYLRTAAALALLVRHADLNEPLREHRDTEEWRRQRAEAQRMLSAIEREYRSRLAASLSNKTGEARAVTTMALASASADEDSGSPAPEVDLSAVFGDLPADRQLALLEHEWERLDPARVRPALLRLVETAPDAPQQRIEREPDVRSAALRRLAEIDPEGARPLLLAELARYPLRVDAATLALLPDETLPELDPVLAAHVDMEASDFELRLHAVERYASPALAERVAALYTSEDAWACEPQATMLAYILRVDANRGVALLRRALALRKETGCYRSVLSRVASMHRSEALLQVARERLSDRNAEVRRDARDVLAGEQP